MKIDRIHLSLTGRKLVNDLCRQMKPRFYVQFQVSSWFNDMNL